MLEFLPQQRPPALSLTLMASCTVMPGAGHLLCLVSCPRSSTFLLQVVPREPPQHVCGCTAPLLSTPPTYHSLAQGHSAAMPGTPAETTQPFRCLHSLEVQGSQHCTGNTFHTCGSLWTVPSASCICICRCSCCIRSVEFLWGKTEESVLLVSGK